MLIFCVLKKIYPSYVSKHNSYSEKQVIILFIPNGEGWHYIAVERLFIITTPRRFLSSKFSSFFWHRKQRESHKKVCENKDFCNFLMPVEDTKILEFNQYQKSDKAPFIIYADLECLIENIDGFKKILKIHPK